MEATKKGVITEELVEEAMSYEEYRSLIDSLLEEGKTTGGKQSEELTDYTRMNVQRMNRLDKRTELSESLRNRLEELDREMVWVVLTEGWCGDAAQNVPAINRIAEATPKIELRLLLRDEHPEVMDQYLTNGTRSIPKLIALDAESLEELGTWGPRPETAQQNVQEWKHEYDKEEWAKMLHKWYAKDKTAEIQSEFEELIAQWDRS